MLTIPATEIKQRLGQYLENALVEPVLVEKSGRPSVVIISVSEYERLRELEDAWWAEKAKKAAKKGFLTPKQSAAWARRMQEKLDEDA